MPDCTTLETLVTPYVDGELPGETLEAIEQHLRACPPCRSRVAAERAVHRLLSERKAVFRHDGAPASLKARCSQACRVPALARGSARAPWWSPFRATGPASFARAAAAAALVVLIGGALLYQATDASTRVMAAELTADHVKCFALNAVLRTHQSPEAVESAMLEGFDWRLSLPDGTNGEGLELVGSRPCLYGEGQVAHVMFRHHGQPVSLFMLPRSERPEEILRVLGHECAIWSIGDRTFVLVAREERADVERMAALVQASME
jgi:anti-sigma factor RsiW